MKAAVGSRGLQAAVGKGWKQLTCTVVTTALPCVLSGPGDRGRGGEGAAAGRWGQGQEGTLHGIQKLVKKECVPQEGRSPSPDAHTGHSA